MALLYQCYYYFFFFFCFLHLVMADEQVLHNQDLHPLLSFKASLADPSNTSLNTWVGVDPCSGSWVGVQCRRGRVVSVRLDSAFLVGNVAPLLELSRLQVLSLRGNALGGTLPHLTNFKNPKLRHLLLSDNQLTGPLNVLLPRLLSLRLEHNRLSGGLEGLRVHNLEDLNVSDNRLSGKIDHRFSRFPISAFGRNLALCGSPLPTCGTSTGQSPTTSVVGVHDCSRKSLTKLGMTVVLAVGLANALVFSVSMVVLVIGFYMWFTRRHPVVQFNRPTSDHGHDSYERYDKKRSGDREGLVRFQGGEDLRLESLLKATAEVLGKGVSGSTYKAVLDGGLVVAVKRLSSVRFPTSQSKCCFDRHMDLMGRLRHCNVVSLRAYCDAQEEKLLVYDYMPRGSLHSLLYGTSRGCPRSTVFDWKSRKEFLLGAAQGLNFIHTFPARPPLVHANIKPSNILVDGQGNACISEWGLMVFARTIQPSPLHSSPHFSNSTQCKTESNWHGYRAPELVSGKKSATQESDVYGFGMVLLELVTDKEMDCEETMEMVKIGLMCTKECPEERPKMSQVVSMIMRIL